MSSLSQEDLLLILKGEKSLSQEDSILEVWTKSQFYEREWWLTHNNLYDLEKKKSHFVARMMYVENGFPTKSIMDIGCGPFSILQTVPFKSATGVDPIHYGSLEDEYTKKGIRRLYKCGEDLTSEDGHYDEVWIYNCLQHVKNPTAILKNAIKLASVVRIWEWVYSPVYEGHHHSLTPDLIQSPFKEQKWSLVQKSEGYINHNYLGDGGEGGEGHYFTCIYSKEHDFEFNT